MSAYSGHAEMCAAIHANDEVEMLVTLAGDMPELLAYPVSGDMLAVMQHAAPHARRVRRARATAERNGR